MRPQRYPGSFTMAGHTMGGHLVKYFIFGMKDISFIISNHLTESTMELASESTLQGITG